MCILLSTFTAETLGRCEWASKETPDIKLQTIKIYPAKPCLPPLPPPLRTLKILDLPLKSHLKIYRACTASKHIRFIVHVVYISAGIPI